MSLGNPLNLAAPEYANPSEPPAYCDLIYKGKRHAISGPPETAKTLLAHIVGLEARRAGARVAFIDFESGPSETRRLLEDLGATPEEIAALHYYEADGPPEGDDLQRLIIDAGVDLVIIDAAAGAYEASGLDESDRGDIEKWAKAWVRPLWRAGIATLLIDHVVKNHRNRGAFAIGGERKLGGVDVHLGLTAVLQMSRGTSGLIKITTHKDRPAWLPRPRTGDLELLSDPVTHAITWRIKPASDDQAEPGGWRPTRLMQRVSEYLERQEDDVPVTAIYSAVTGKTKYIGEAIVFLVEDGYATEQPGKYGSRMIGSTRPYREPVPSNPVPTLSPPVEDDPAPTRFPENGVTTPKSKPAPTLPQSVPTAKTQACPPVPSPLGEDRTGLQDDGEANGNGHIDQDEIERLAALARAVVGEPDADDDARRLAWLDTAIDTDIEQPA